MVNFLRKLGKTTNKSGIATINPPITAMANACCIWAPIPTPIASGIRAKMALKAVIKLGRNRK